MKIISQPGYHLPAPEQRHGAGESPRRDQDTRTDRQLAVRPSSKTTPVYSSAAGFYNSGGKAVITGGDSMEMIPAGYYQRGAIVNVWA